ncbi:hypothetical protein RQP54_15730 [Curvibacter sp. APW13]|uniref:hypothetical protein n=1 Tax=Curvibacter sp. APW13 TaxID=3077236 RepID=UPI0028DE46B7|nr:hypothetical protein [Curvibacter sp. APW13]MDT8992323.1 hypothetical protein [Curvibacter sp. APW13]
MNVQLHENTLPSDAPMPRGRLQRLPQWLGKHWLVTALLVLYLLLQAYWLAWSWVTTPTINPHPTDLVTIRGTFPFDKGYTMELFQEALTSTAWVNKWCAYPMRSEGFPCHGGRQRLTVKQLDPQHYELTFYRDYYLSGIAGWQHGGLALRMPRADRTFLRGGGESFPVSTKAAKCSASNSADGSLICSALDLEGPNIYVPPTSNLEVNFYLKSELPAHLANTPYR